MGTTRYHTPLTGGDLIDHTTLNAILASLDAEITTYKMTGTAGEALSERDFVYLASDGTWYQLDTNAVGSIAASGWLGCVTESGGISSSGTGAIVARGIVSGFTGLTAGGVVYGGTTAGSYTQTKPAVTDGGGQVAIVELGLAISLTEVLFKPGPIRYSKRETLADDAELTIEHHSNPQTRARRVWAYVGDSYDEPLFIGSTSGDSEEVGVEYGDGAGSDEDTKTTFKNLTGSSADLTCIVEVL